MAPRRLFQFLRALLRPAPLFGLAIVAIFWIGLVHLLKVERSKAVESAVQRGSSLTHLFEQNTIRLLKGVDQTLLLFRLAYEENPKSFDLRHWAERTSFIGELTIQAAIIGPDGYLRATTAAYSGADRWISAIGSIFEPTSMPSRTRSTSASRSWGAHLVR